MELQLNNFIKYCLGYIKLTRRRGFAAQKKYSAELPKEHFTLTNFLGTDIELTRGELIDLDTFYNHDPKTVPASLQDKYRREKELANKLEEIYNQYKNNQFTKQVVLYFGYFEIEVPLEGVESEADIEDEEGPDAIDATLHAETLAMFPGLGQAETAANIGSEDAAGSPKVKVDRYPLFSLPVRIEKEYYEGVGKYFLYPADPDVQVNVSLIEPVLGEDSYFQLIEEIGKFEIEDRLALPLTEDDVFREVWHRVKAQLRLKEAKFDENSFSVDTMSVSVSPRANYFLAEDLQKLSKLGEDELKGSALSGWVDDKDLNIEDKEPQDNDLYFPFPYDKYQLRALSIIKNRAAVIQGPPGTGKSETIANILSHLAATGKKVLFVSQKTQALKVVKDKLKRLDVKYLFGYIPNPASAQLGEEDLAEGIAPQLTALEPHVDKLVNDGGQRKRREGGLVGVKAATLGEAVELKKKLSVDLTRTVEAQRRYCALFEQLQQLKEYEMSIADISKFRQVFSNGHWHEIRKIIADILKLTAGINEYENDNRKNDYDKLFFALNINDAEYSKVLQKLRDDVGRTGYDRNVRIIRNINNILRKFRLRKSRSLLPREIINCVDHTLGSDISRRQAELALESLCRYCRYYEDVELRSRLGNELRSQLDTCGLTIEQFYAIDSLSKKYDAVPEEEIKRNILRTHEIRLELRVLERSPDTNKISNDLKDAERSRFQTIAQYIQNIINQNLVKQWNLGISIRRIINRLARAFSKSKKAYKTFDQLRKNPENVKTIMGLIPVWIMELDDASRILPFEKECFDYVILDEASQCNIAYTLPSMYRARCALFVGDSEQMRDNTIIFKSNKAFDDLAQRYQIPDDMQIKATGNSVQSVLDIARSRSFKSIPLRYHYRSPAELIGFSNRYFYKPNGKELIALNNNYMVFGDTNRIMSIHHVQPDLSNEISDKINITEAKDILKFFKYLRADKRYQDKSVGILSFFNAQAACIRNIFEQNGLREDKDNYKVSIVEGIQGDEKDIIIYSFVMRSPEQKKKYVPLTGEGGDIRADINKGRVNVAFSRAKLQVHCFISMPIADVPDKIWIKKYLEYVNEHGIIGGSAAELQPFDSHFEEDFYNIARSKLGRNYTIQNQVKSCGFRIDFVIGNVKNGTKIAVECDGPTHFKDEIDEEYGIYVESDEERQRVLEAAGWRFYRIKYSDWIIEKFDRNRIVQDIVQRLN